MIVVKDSKEGWAKAYRQLLALLWAGEIPKWDVSRGVLQVLDKNLWG